MIAGFPVRGEVGPLSTLPFLSGIVILVHLFIYSTERRQAELRYCIKRLQAAIRRVGDCFIVKGDKRSEDVTHLPLVPSNTLPVGVSY